MLQTVKNDDFPSKEEENT